MKYQGNYSRIEGTLEPHVRNPTFTLPREPFWDISKPKFPTFSALLLVIIRKIRHTM